MSIDTARAAARDARTARALDKLYRDRATGETYTQRERLDADAYAYRLHVTHRDGTHRYGLIEHADADAELADARERYPHGREFYPGQGDPLQALQFAAYVECAKLVFDYADALPLVRVTPDSFTAERMITDAEWAHLTTPADTHADTPTI